MADKKGNKGASKAPAVKKEKKAYVYASSYEVSGDALKRKNKSCPKCGSGYFLAEHKDRLSCGKCGYMEKKAKSE
jgi:small subunit ribosomal protein S27Ae